MFREGLGKNECMVIAFPNEGFWDIWMRNMRFPIDVAWVNGSGKVVCVRERLQPCSSILGCETYVSEEKAKYVIEFNAGTTKRIRMKKSTKINIGL